MRFNENVRKTAPQRIKQDPTAMAAYIEEYDKSLGGRLSNGECPGHSQQTLGHNSVCLRCGGRV